MKKILFVASECVPFIKTGGLADVVGSLPKIFNKKEYDVRVIIPNYECIKSEYKSKMKDLGNFYLDDIVYVGIKTLKLDGIQYYFIDNEYYFKGEVPYYDLFQDIERFAYFSKAALSILPVIDFRPEIIHCHDWQAGLVPVYLNSIFQGNEFYCGIRTIMTVHNLRFQGKWNVAHIQGVTRLPDECFAPGRLVSLNQDMGVLREHREANLLRGGLVYSDYITTVSNTYAGEIQTPYYGEGLDDLLRGRSDRLWGIVNGIDYKVYNPETDEDLYFNYSQKNFRTMKKKNKKKLQEELGLEVSDKMFTIAIISRLTDQKGLDIVDYVMDRICASGDIQFIVLGTGDGRYEDMFRYYQGKYPNNVSANICYSDALSHKIYGSVDAMLVPSQFEPCGLTQLMALRYGTVPIVRETGGLKDTVEAYNEFEQTGTGFSFANYNGDELFDQIEYAKSTFYEQKAKWNKIVDRGMKTDWSWDYSAGTYKALYDEILG
ncbi:MAG: glycogen synthase [Anaerostipes sp.]|jgi:starch synthase|nr:glycogen synthase [Anaerostipes sp.]MDD3744996.1 glycogen synthase [Anaerostipes sp.]